MWLYLHEVEIVFYSEDHENFTQTVEMTLTPDMVAAQFSIIDPKVPTEEKIAP